MRFVAGLLLLSSVISNGMGIGPSLVNGTPVPEGTFDEIVRLSMGCTGTIVGPRTIVTAAHCGKEGAKTTFKFKGKKFTAVLHTSRYYRTKDHDLSIGVTTEAMEGAKPFSLGGEAKVDQVIHIFGYGCTAPDGTGGNDGILREGKAVVRSFRAYDMVSFQEGGAGLCPGDSGGPVFVDVDGEPRILAVNSKVEVADNKFNGVNMTTRWDMADSKLFLKRVAQEQKLKICGYNTDCD